MTIFRLSFRVPYSADRDCTIIIHPQEAAYQAVCKDTATGLTIGSAVVPCALDRVQPVVTADDVLRLMGGMYRLASVAVDIDAKELARRTRRVSDQLRLRGRLWRRRSRRRIGNDASKRLPAPSL